MWNGWVTSGDWIFIKRGHLDHNLKYSIRKAKFTGIAWTHDEKGFFYNRYPRPSEDVKDAGTETDKNLNAFLCYHRVGTPQEEDVVCFKDADHP